MVKGITRQVIIVKGSDTRLFDQAIFLVRDDVLSEGGITEDLLLQEARQACKRTEGTISIIQKLIWSSIGAGLIAILWGIASLI